MSKGSRARPLGNVARDVIGEAAHRLYQNRPLVIDLLIANYQGNKDEVAALIKRIDANEVTTWEALNLLENQKLGEAQTAITRKES